MQATSQTFQWTAHPLREHPVKAVLAVVLILFCGVLVGLLVADPLASPLAAGGAILFLFLTLNRFFLPSTYWMDEGGLAARYPLTKRDLRWSEIKQFRHDQEGGYVSPRAKGGVFDTAGISLLFGRHAEEIVPRIQSALESRNNLSSSETVACRPTAEHVDEEFHGS